jgi:hypothetical protein
VRKQRLVFSLSLIAVNIVAFQNCSKVSFTSADATKAAAGNGGLGQPGGTGTDPNSTGGTGGTGGNGVTPPGGKTPGGITDPGGVTPPPGQNVVIYSLQPALASRATGCIMCHANIASNVITDFGFGGDGKGKDYFFGGDAATLPKGLSNTQGLAVYGDYDFSTKGAVNWGSADLTGSSVIVPYAPTTNVNVAQPTLALYLKNILSQNPNPTAQAVAVKEVKSVYIGAPNADRLRSVSGVSAGGIKFKPSDANSPAFSGLALDASGNFYTNGTDPVVCEGDLAIDGVVWLNNVKIKTDKGCRLYVTKSVFVTGTISYTSSDAGRNLQISSARAISLGLGKSCSVNGSTDSLEARLDVNSSDGSGRYQDFFTRDNANPGVMLAAVRADADAIGVLKDATCGPNGRSVGFERLLLNAPLVESRYQGLFDGAIIAELTLTSLQSLSFTFDQVFATASVLPLLTPSDYLDIQM